MARSGYKYLYVFKLDVFGGAESHVINITNPVVADNAAIDVAKKRIAMLPVGTELYRMRRSNLVSPFDTQLIDPANWANAPHWPAPTGITGTPDQPKATILVNFATGAKANGNHYLFGVPDTVIGESPTGVAPRMDPSWQTAFNNWKAALLLQWGMSARTPMVGAFAPVMVTVSSTDPVSGQMQVAVIGSLAGAAIGKPVQLRNFKRSNVSYKSANGKYKINKIEPDVPVAGQTRYTLAGPTGIDISTIVFQGTIEVVDYSFISYSDITIQGQTVRKRGNRSLTGPGKRSTRRTI